MQLLCWGQSSFRILDLSIDAEKKLNVSLSAASAEYLAPDWILGGCVNALRGQKRTARRAHFITAHNALLDLHVVDGGCRIHLQQLMTGVKTLLYSADTVALSPTHILIAAGTVFGEVIVWSCFWDYSLSGNSSSIHHFFTGHEGSIFGVRISPIIPALNGRLLASCSDDRTIRIWDITGCEHARAQDPSAYVATDGFELRSTTGFGNDDIPAAADSCLAKEFGHVARIWDVYFAPGRSVGSAGLTLISRSEDATCLVWDLTWDPATGSSFQLHQRASLLHHSGKHIWSLDMCSTEDDGTIVYTGGADGALKASTITLGLLGREDDLSSLIVKTHGKNADGAVRAFCFVAPDCFLAVSLRGEVRLGWIRAAAGESKPVVSYETLSVMDELCPHSIVSGLSDKGLALLCNSEGLIRVYDHASKSLSAIPIRQQQERQGLRTLGLHILHSGIGADDALYFVTDYQVADKADFFMVKGWKTAVPQVDRYTLTLPATFWVTRASLIGQYIVLGSRAGAVAVYGFPDATKIPTLQPLACYRRVHSLKGISSMSTLSAEREYLVTSGRDGDYCLHEVKASQRQNNDCILETIHRSSCSLIPDIEGVYIDKNSHHLLLFGFHGRDFIVWNESTQSELAVVDCGGVHRSWAFCPNDLGGTFLWNKFPGVRAQCIRTASHRLLRAGGHGREIKSLAVCNPTASQRAVLFATGAEDTRVRIFATTGSSSGTEGPWGAFECMRVLNVHSTGLQQVSWSKDGRYLFTSAGHEEFFAWRIRSIPRFGVAGVLTATAPKGDSQSDLRVTSFDVLDAEDGFVLCLTFSNSTIKIFHFSPSAEEHNHFALLAKGRYTSNCLTQVHFLLKPTSVNLVTAATDGYVTLWNVTTALEPFYSISPSTEGVLLRAKRHATTSIPADITCDNRYQMHPNSIKCMEVAHVLSNTVMITGGDDNALTVSLIQTTQAGAPMADLVRVPDAHASTISTTRIVRQNHHDSELLIATSGNDHRVKMWRIYVDPDAEKRIRVEMVLDRYSSVADISSLDVIRGALGSLLVVCGVGMEMMRIEQANY